MTFRRLLLACTFLTCHALPAAAEDYPNKPISIVVPFAAGGGVDILTRVLAQHLTDRLEARVLVENRVGAGGNVGVDMVAKAAPDGYTFVMATTGTHTINPGLYRNLPFNAEKDFKPVTLIASVPNLLVVNTSVPAKSVQELIDHARSKPGALNFGSFGNGTSNHLSGELLKSTAHIDVVHVPYKNAPQAVTDLIGERVAFAFVNTPLALPHVRAGKLRALAVTGKQRSAATPEYPTMEEAGVEGFVVESWYGLMAPAGTPDKIIQRVRAATIAVLAKPEVKEFFMKQGADIVTSTPEAFATMAANERDRWAQIIKASGARID
ncbi:MAG: tripartite tricarboxylate transporter substrate binding protein [Lautropia sp.]|nr:tripartite tricarboxylate transporter substrate binding protein [Lautropia sp.]